MVDGRRGIVRATIGCHRGPVLVDTLRRQAQSATTERTIMGLFDKAKDMAEDARDKIGDAAEAAVEKVDEMTGGKVPDAIKDAVDKIDGEEG